MAKFLAKLWKCLFVWHLDSSWEDIADADVVLTMAGALNRDGTPGHINEILADVLQEIKRRLPNMPIIAQQELAETAKDLEYLYVVRRPTAGTIKRSTLSWNTTTIAREQIRKVYTTFFQKWRKKVALLAEPDHQLRYKMVVEREARNFQGPLYIVIVPVPSYREKSYRHPNSCYWSQRGRQWRFKLRELTLRIACLLLGKI